MGNWWDPGSYITESAGGKNGQNAWWDPGGFYTKNETPDSPDFMQLAEQQSYANRVNQSTPWGSQNYTAQKVIDPATGKPVTQWSSSVSLDPRLQAALESQMGITQSNSALAQRLSGQLGDTLGQPMQSPELQTSLDYSGLQALSDPTDVRNRAEDALYSRATARLDPQWNQREEQMRARLANQGLDPGSEAYTNAMGDLNTARNDAYSSAMNDAITGGGAEASRQFGMDLSSRQQGASEIQNAAAFGNQSLGQQYGYDLQARELPLNEISALLSGGSVQMPNFTGAPSGGNYQAAGQQGYQSALDAYNAQQGQQQSRQAGLLGLAGAAFSAFSDERLKTNIKRYDTEALPGVRFASWEWRDQPGSRDFGVIAQDVQKVRPDLVHEDAATGFLKVDYSFLLEPRHG